MHKKATKTLKSLYVPLSNDNKILYTSKIRNFELNKNWQEH